MWFEFRGQMQFIYKQAYCIFFVHFVFLLLWLYGKKGVNGLGKRKRQRKKIFVFSSIHLSLYIWGGVCKRKRDYNNTKK